MGFPKKMLVWDTCEDRAMERTVLYAYRDGTNAVTVRREDEQAFGNAERFYTNQWNHCKPLPEPPKMRRMTREEKIGFIVHNPHIVVKQNGEQQWRMPQYDIAYNNSEWATITEDGTIGEPHRFETKA